MKYNKNMFDKILTTFHHTGILKNIILLGSWCLVIYRAYFDNAPEIPLLRTTDIDFMVPNPPIISTKYDVTKILNEFGFDETFSIVNGYSKFTHPELEVEFITPEFGKGKNKPYIIKSLNISAQGLRYIGLVQNNTITVDYKNISVTVPEPCAFILIKYLASSKRLKIAKKKKDILTANQLSEFLLEIPTQKNKLVELFASIPGSWKKSILHIVKLEFKQLYDLFNTI